MGWFSSKTKKYYGVSHSRMIPDKEIPRVLIDSTAAYLEEASSGTNLDLVDFNTLGIENALSTKLSRIHQWLMRNPHTFDGIRPLTPTYYATTDNKVVNTLKQLVERDYPDSTIEYMYLELSELSMVHSTYIVLSDKHGFDADTNKIYTTTSKGKSLSGHLEGVTLFLAPRLFDIPVGFENKLLPGPELAYSFVSGVTPFRKENRELLNPPDYIQRSADNTSYFEFNVVKKYTKKETTEYIRTEVYTERGEPISSDVSSTTDIQEDPKDHSYSHIETETTTTDSGYKWVSYTEDENSNKVVGSIRTVVKTDNIKATYSFRDDYTELLDYEKAIKQYQDSLNINPEASQKEKDRLLKEAENYYKTLQSSEGKSEYAQVGFYTVNSAGLKKLHYKSYLTKDVTDAITKIRTLNPARFAPDIYIRARWDFLYEKKKAANLEAYKDMNRISKKLGINYDLISEQMKSETSDLHLIPTMYITYGIPIGETSDVAVEYLYKYIEGYFNACDLDGQYSGPAFSPIINTETVNRPTHRGTPFTGQAAERYIQRSEVYGNIDGVANSNIITTQNITTTDTGFIVLHPFNFKQQYAFIQIDKKRNGFYAEVLDKKKLYIVKGLDFVYGDSFSNKWISCNYIAKSYIYGSIGPVGTYKKKLAWVNGGSRKEPLLAIRKQVTEEYFVIYQIHGLNVTKEVLDSSAGYQDKEDILLPLDFDLYRETVHGIKNREQFIYRSLYIEAQTYQKVKTKWYQRGWVKKVLIAVSVISFFFGPAGVAANGWAQALINLAVMTVVVEVTVWALGKVLSPEHMQIVAGLVTIAGISGKFGGWSGVQYNTRAFTVFLLNTKTLLAVAGKLRELSIETINDEFKEKERMHVHRMAQLEAKEANVAYRPSTGLNYQNEDLRVYPVMQDSNLDSMIARTLNPNPGRLSIEYTHNYVDYILGLPTPQETVYKRYKNFN